MTPLVDGKWMRLGDVCLAVSATRSRVRTLAERGMIEATTDERGYLLIAAKDLPKARRLTASKAPRANAA